MGDHIDHSEIIISSIDNALNAPPIPIEQALDYAVQHGNMTIKESEECLEAYLRAFHGEPT